jgi:hypothetical protein
VWSLVSSIPHLKKVTSLILTLLSTFQCQRFHSRCVCVLFCCLDSRRARVDPKRSAISCLPEYLFWNRVCREGGFMMLARYRREGPLIDSLPTPTKRMESPLFYHEDSSQTCDDTIGDAAEIMRAR